MRLESKGSYDSGNTQEAKRLTQRQELYLEAYRKLGSVRQVAVEMGVASKTARDQLSSAAQKMGYESIRELATENTPRTARSKEGKASAQELFALIELQEYRCQLSGVKLEPSTASLDHKIPVSCGGSDSIENLQWVSNEVNRAKGSMDQKAFIEMCKRVAAWNG